MALGWAAWAVALGLAALFATDPRASAARLGKALWPGLVLVAGFHASAPRTGRRSVALLLASGGLAALIGLAGYLAAGEGYPARARGPTGHYMTFGGQLMLLVALAAGIALRARVARWRLGALAVAGVAAAALAFTYTRSAWLGTGTALLVLAAIVRPRVLPIVLAGLIAAYAFAPGAFRDRARSIFDVHHPTNIERTLMWEAGGRMFRAHPLTGVGLQDLKSVYDRYRSPLARERPGHFHSIYVQVAATMGVVGLAAFVLLYTGLLRAAAAGLRSDPDASGIATGVQAGVVAGLAGFLVAGAFEWNFGDEELLMLLYTLVGLAWAARAWKEPAGGADAP